MDLISRQAAIDVLKGMAVPLYKDSACEDIWERDRTLDNAIDAIRGLPSAQPEGAIPVAWLEEQAKWFESMDNAFAKIEASNIRVMIKKWRVKNEDYSI